MTALLRAERTEVFAPARLHLGFLDLNGNLGRKFGSIGLTIEGIGTHLVLTRAATPAADGPNAARALPYLTEAARALDLPATARIEILQAIPEHVGLGSGTQLGIAIAAGLARLHGMQLGAASLAKAVGRGQRSGIGIGAFEQGGFLVDGGRGGDGVAPIIARLEFPVAWRVLLIFDRALSGLHGENETNAFRQLPPLDEEIAGRLCRLLVMQLLPGLATQEFTAVTHAIAEIQERIGDYFAAAQGGRYASQAVAGILAWLRGQGITGIGQTSWGPTGFALIDGAVRASEVETALRRQFGGDDQIDFQIVTGRNHGADIVVGA